MSSDILSAVYISYLILPSAWRPHTANDHRQEELGVNLLQVGQLWNVPEAISHAQTILEELHLPATRRIQLARMFSLHHWVRLAVVDLMKLQFNALTPDQFLELGLPVLSILVKTKENRLNYRQTVAHVAPKLREDPDHDCLNHARCHAVWKEAWWRHVAKKILHPNNDMPIINLDDFARGLTIEGMTWSCQYDVMANWTSREEGMITQAVDKIIDYHKSLL